MLPDWKTIKKIWPNILSGGLIGTFIGAIPGRTAVDIAVFRFLTGASKSAASTPSCTATGPSPQTGRCCYRVRQQRLLRAAR